MPPRRETFGLPPEPVEPPRSGVTQPCDVDTDSHARAPSAADTQRADTRTSNKPDDDQWQLRDIGMGLVFLITGGNICFLAWKLLGTTLPTVLLVLISPLAFLIGPIMVLLGLNAIIRALIAGLRGDF